MDEAEEDNDEDQVQETVPYKKSIRGGKRSKPSSAAATGTPNLFFFFELATNPREWKKRRPFPPGRGEKQYIEFEAFKSLFLVKNALIAALSAKSAEPGTVQSQPFSPITWSLQQLTGGHVGCMGPPASALFFSFQNYQWGKFDFTKSGAIWDRPRRPALPPPLPPPSLSSSMASSPPPSLLLLPSPLEAD